MNYIRPFNAKNKNNNKTKQYSTPIFLEKLNILSLFKQCSIYSMNLDYKIVSVAFHWHS